jgi:hypothetical protein
VAAARLSIRPRPMPAPAQRQLRVLLRAAYRRPGTRASTVLANVGAPGGRRLLTRADIDPAAMVEQITAEQWHCLALLLSVNGPST